MTTHTHTFRRVGLSVARLGVVLLAVAVVVIGTGIISLLFGAHPYWWVWVIGGIALIGSAFTGDAGMALYILKRLLWAILVVNVVVFVTFLVFFKLPNGDPALRFVGKFPTAENLAEARSRLHLDQPFYKEYFYFVENFVKGDENGWPGLGYSYGNYVSVRTEVVQRAPRTLMLIGGAAIIWLVFGVTIGVISAVKRRTIVDRGAMGFALFGISAPVFWLGLMALYLVWKKAGLTGGSGYTPLDQGVGQWASHMILPWFVLALLYMAIYARLTRNNLLETLGEDYIRTARAKGLSERKVILKHGLRASLTPIVTIFGLDMALLVGGAIITESVFNIQGLGWLAINGANTQDLPSVLGVVICTATAVVIANLIVDIIYAFLDPRIRYA
jgi:peptide/nickel transport system permease protein